MSFFMELNTYEREIAVKHQMGVLFNGDFLPPFEIPAAYHIGLNYHQHKGDIQKAKYFYEKAVEFYRSYSNNNKDVSPENLKKVAQESYIFSLFNLGVIHRDGLTGQPDYAKAVACFEECISYGDADAAYFLGCMYVDGVGVPINPELGFQYTLQAAEKNNIYAQNSVGRLYEFGVGTAKDLDKAQYWYQLAADQGDELAAENLSRMYGNKNISLTGSFNEYIEKETSPKIDKILSSSEDLLIENVCNDCLHIRREYEDEHYLTYCTKHKEYISSKTKCDDFIDKLNLKSAAEALKEETCCSKCPHKENHLLLNQIFHYCSVKKNYPHLYKTSCKGCTLEHCTPNDLEPQDDPELAKAKQAGQLVDEGVKRIEKKDYSGVELLSQAAQLGNLHALFNLGQVYCIKGDYRKAYDYFKQAADQNHQEALNNLGYMYENGMYVKEDPNTALKLLAKAATLGSENACLAIQKLAATGDKRGKAMVRNIMHELNRKFKEPYEDYMLLSLQRYGTSSESVATGTPLFNKANAAKATALKQGINDTETLEVFSHNRKLQRLLDRAQKNNAYSQYQLAQCFEQGTYGLKPNLEQALVWYEKALAHGYRDAEAAIKKLKE